MKVAACVQVTEDAEPINAAIQSICHNRDAFTWVFIESPSGKSPLLHPATAALLGDLVIRNTTDISKDLPNECDGVIFIPPQCALTQSGLDKFMRVIKTNSISHPHVTHYSMSTVTTIPTPEWSIWYGFLIVLWSLDTFWTWFDRYRHPLDYHIRWISRVKVGNNSYLAHRQWSWRIWNTGEYPSVTGGLAAEIKPERPITHFTLVANVIKRHFYWMRPLSSPFGNLWYLLWLSAVWGIGNLLYKQQSWTLLMGIYGVSSLLLYLQVRHQLRVPGIVILCALWPIYFAGLLPLGIFVHLLW